jgi:hypothetical protein
VASIFYEQKRNSPDAVAVWTVHLHFDPFETLPAYDFYWSTTQTGVTLADDNFYEHALTEPAKGRHQRDRGNDYSQFSVANPDNRIWDQLMPLEDLFERGEIVVCECYEIAGGYFEEEIRFIGFVKDFTVNDAGPTVDFTCQSDMSRTGFLVGNRILTRDRCGTAFNINGLVPANKHLCGWQTSQGGNPLFCSKLVEGIDGCKAHNNLHRIIMVPGLNSAIVEVVAPGAGGFGTGDETGFDYQTDPCFTGRMRMVMDEEFRTLPLDKVKEGMRHIGFDPFGQDRLVESSIRWAGTHETDHYWTARFDLATIEAAAHHLFYIGNRRFVPLRDLGRNPAVGMDFERKPARSDLWGIQRVLSNDLFYEFHTTSANYIITDEAERFYYFVHNIKPQTYNQF